ncbi:MAG TPA: SRPBCC domain-containing protein [Opitutaceae bacterium]|jgi:uncharacterized protein YndB with AHSA1/START domain|nr:SRPBCC domain-containing protein [Opitutaceae bacterium]
MNKNNPTGISDREIVISRVFDAPRELVWEAWTNPAHVAQWWGPDGFTITIEKMEVRPGGVWQHVMHGPDGTDYPNKSVFTEVVEPERIVYEHGGSRKGGPGIQFTATWTFEQPRAGQTKLTIRMIFPSAEARDTIVKEYGAIEGGKQTLARLAEHLAAKNEPVVIERTFNAPVGMVWKAITDQDQMKAWSFDIKEFKPEVGFEFQFYKTKDGLKYIHRCKVTGIVPEKKLAYSWRYEGHEGNSHVTFELFPEGKKTRLKLTHEGLDSFPKMPVFDKKNFVWGWTMLIGTGLKEYVEEIAPIADRVFVISRMFDAPRELVWKAWTEPKHMAQWWGPSSFTTPVCELDVRPGGAYRIVMRGADGVDYPITGVYREIVPPARLVMTMDCTEHPAAWHDMVKPDRKKGEKNPAGEMLQTVTFESFDGKTKLTIRICLETAAIRDAMVKMGMNEGWSLSLDRLAELVAKTTADI